MKVYVNMPADIGTEDGIQKMAKDFLKANSLMLYLGHQAYSIMQAPTTWVESKRAEAFVRCSQFIKHADLIYNAPGWQSCPMCVATQALATACGIKEVVAETNEVGTKKPTTVEEAWAFSMNALSAALSNTDPNKLM